jgi:two-component system CheB/CheR fusion protein
MFKPGRRRGTPRARKAAWASAWRWCSELVQMHGGRVEAASDGEGRGAEFTVWLPIKHSTDFGVLDVPKQGCSLAGLRILYVEDSADALESLAMLLEMEGARVSTAINGRRALELAETTPLDLILSDIGMPEMDGYQLIAEVRQRPATRGLHAIAMSGFGRRADARRALEAGFNAHLPKPASIEELKAAIARL